MARMVPLPGSAIPMASQRQFIELAVNIPEQLPSPGQQIFSSSLSCASSILPALNSATPSNMVIMSTALPSFDLPAAIGPPDTKIVGIFSLTAAINIPGMILSQFGMHIRASKQCALAMVSTESAIISLEASEYFIPVCPIAIPSQTAMVLNSKGEPPAFFTDSLTILPTLPRWIWPGTMSQSLLAMPMKGFLMSLSLNPQAWRRPLCGAR